MRFSKLCFFVAFIVGLFPFAKIGAQTCTGLCQQQVICGNNGTTSVSGTVYAPNEADPLPGVTVYVPNGAGPNYGVTPFLPGIASPPTISGSPLVSVNTAADGTFTLTDMPAGTNIPLVIQSGKWRRMVTLPSVPQCTNTPLSFLSTSLPQVSQLHSAMDNVPSIAIVTGSVDSLECSLRQIGIPDTQFNNPGAGQHSVSFYLGDTSPGAQINTNTPAEDALFASSTLNNYDLVLLPNQGSGSDPAATVANQQSLVNYANNGGRVYTSHFSYDWLYNIAPFSNTAAWAVDPTDNNTFGSDPGTGLVNTANPLVAPLAQWLQVVGASTTSGQIPVDNLRDDFTGVTSPSTLWLSVNDPKLGVVPQLYSFDTPVGTASWAQLGRVFFKDFNGGETGSTQGVAFPNECTVGAASPEQKLIEYTLFNLSGFLTPPQLQAAQTISFTTVAPASALSGSNFTVAAVATSNLPVAYTSAGSCTNNGATYTMTSSTGSCSVIANQAGNNAFAAAPQVTETVAAIASQSITVTTPAPSSAAYNSSFTIGASATSSLPVVFTSGGSCSNNGATYAMTSGSGSCSVILDQPGNSSYAAATEVVENVIATAAGQTISVAVPAPGSAAYNSTFAVTASATSGLPVVFTAGGSCTNIGPSFTMTSGAGTCSVSINQAGNGAYSAAPVVNEVVNATPASQSISVIVPAPPTAINMSSFTVAATATSGLPITFGSSGACDNSGATYTITSSTGTCTITMTQSGSGNYAAASLVKESTTVAKALKPTISFTGAPASAVYGSSFNVTATSNSSSTPTIAATGSCTVSGTTVTMIWGVTECLLEATWPASDVYQAAAASQITNATLAAPTVTFTGAPGSAINQSSFVVSTTENSSITPTITATGSCTVSGTTVTMSKGSGTCTTKASWPANDYYAKTTLTQTTTATGLSTTTTVTSTVLQTSPLKLRVTFTVSNGTEVPIGGNVTVKASTGESCTGAVTTASCVVTFNAAGPNSVTADFLGDTNDAPSVSAAYPLTVE